MPFHKTEFPGLLVFEPTVFKDSRGYFFESYNEKTFLNENIDLRFVQDNQSSSSYGVVRGLHYQLSPHAQTKLVRVLNGTILDVAVDIRKNSPTFSRVFSIGLSAENKKQLMIPPGHHLVDPRLPPIERQVRVGPAIHIHPTRRLRPRPTGARSRIRRWSALDTIRP